MRRSSRITKGSFQSRRFRDEEFSLLWPSQDTSVLAMQFIVEFLSAFSSDSDILSFEQAMQAPDADDFRESAKQELREDRRDWRSYKQTNRNAFRGTRFNLAMLYRKLALASEDAATRRAYAQQAIDSLGKHLRREPTPEMISRTLGAECLAAARAE